MANLVDQNTQVAIEIILEMTKLSEKTLLGIFKLANDFLESNKDKNQFFSPVIQLLGNKKFNI